MKQLKSFLNPVNAFGNHLDSIATNDINAVNDEQYKENAQKNLARSNKSFLWGESSKILSSLMTAVLIGTVASVVTSGSFPIAIAAGLGLAAASVASSFVAFKSRGTNIVNAHENNASLAAREHTKELVPELSKAVGAEVKQAFKEAVNEINHEAVLAGASCVDSATPAAAVMSSTKQPALAAAQMSELPSAMIESENAALSGRVTGAPLRQVAY